MALRTHLFPYRTQKLSSIASMVLGGWPPGRVERCRIISFHLYLIYSSIAQLAEHLTVNQRVTGSSPVGRAKNEDIVRYPYFLFLVLMQIKQTTRLTAEGCSTALSPSASSGRKNEDEKSKRSNDSRARNAKWGIGNRKGGCRRYQVQQGEPEKNGRFW